MGTTPPKSTTDQPTSEETQEETRKESSGEIPGSGSGIAAAADGVGCTSGSSTEPEAADRYSRRAALAVGGAVLAACAGLVLYGLLDTDGSDSKQQQSTPAAPVTYEVTGEGTADITYQARNTSGKATVVKAATLPWRTTVDVPLGQDPTVGIVLGEQGGQARCALAIRGQHVQSASATGAFGRATCAGHLPHPDAPES
ncbi:hypothetical protein [Streptomyces acidicola]|uniref:hypothetical protein n=1 Tax=Streptomyces acidicola TaxID=2596892 RepID=UPI003416034A